MKWVFVAGGTGGHVFPALSIAQCIQKTFPEDEILFVGRKGSVEHRLVEKSEYPMFFIKSSGLNGKGLGAKIKSIGLLCVSFVEAFKLIWQEKPQVVFGIGGYLSGAVLLVSSCFPRVQTGILEPNAEPGLSNKILSKVSEHTFVAFEKAMAFFNPKKVKWVGNPIRENILNLSSGRKAIETILISGGSQGAQQVNNWVMDVLPEIIRKFPNLKVIHQTGALDFEKVKQFYKALQIESEVSPFFEDMADVYERTDLAISRSGSSVLELCACGIPSILIPYPYSADSHQDANADELVSIGAAVSLDSKNGSSEGLKRALFELLEHPDNFSKMSQNSLKYRFDQASEKIISTFRRPQ